ncbi:MAG: hypothetical protein O2856_00695 [Planctomycetota bacterium]|nr:hypothetical protein [Planctomycetota bacterium]
MDKLVFAFDFTDFTMIPNDAIRPSSFKQEFLHLSALNAFALAQPILERLADNALFLKGCDYSGTAVLVSIGLILTVIPVSVLLMTAALRWRGWSRAANVVLGLATGLLSVMSLLTLTRWISVSLNLMNAGIPDSVLAIFAVCGGLASVWLYFWSGRFRQVLSLCAVGVILFPLSFFSTAAIQEHVRGISVRPERIPGTARNPAPVIMIVFDGLCGMALLNEEHEVDRGRYPSFARLADTSSFYRNATTVHPRTLHALPAILSSCIPEEHQRPVEADYPTNLFRAIYETGQYDMSVFEPCTHFCAEELVRIHRSLTLTEQTGHLLNILMRVYAVTTLPRAMV